jgi:hypothetical protein
MIRLRLIARGGTLLAALALSACAPSPPPITSLEGRACTPAPDFTTARPLRLDSNNRVTVDLDQNASCSQTSDGALSAYVLFSLPDSLEPYLVTVTSQSQGQTLFAPRLLVLDGLGNPLREMPRSSFQYHGAALYLGIRIYPGEKYVMVASDPRAVGQQVSQLRAGTQANTVASGGIYFTYYTGFEANQIFTFAFNGKVTVSAEPMPKVR